MSLARSCVWWSGMDSGIEDKVKAYPQCQLQLYLWEWPGCPWSFSGPFMGHMFLVMVEFHFKWLDVHIMSSIMAPVPTETLRSIAATHGLPDAVVTDNWPTFTCGVFQVFMERNGIRHVCIVPHHAASNGLAERAVETPKGQIIPHITTGESTAQMLLGRP